MDKMAYLIYCFDSITMKTSGPNINVTSLAWLFSDCYSLKSVDLSDFDISEVTSFMGTFYYCYNLVSIKFGNYIAKNVK